MKSEYKQMNRTYPFKGGKEAYQMFSIDLLEYLTWKTGYFCMSDLRGEIHKRKLKHILEQAPPEQCSRKEWINAAPYVAGQVCTTAEEARSALLQWTNE